MKYILYAAMATAIGSLVLSFIQAIRISNVRDKYDRLIDQKDKVQTDLIRKNSQLSKRINELEKHNQALEQRLQIYGDKGGINEM